LVPFETALCKESDPMRLARAFGCDVLTVFRRLAFRKEAKLGLVICDGSGGLIMRKPVEGFSLPRHGTACPLWPLYTALSRPSQPVSNIVEMPGLAPLHFVLRAYCAVDYPSGFGGPEVRDAAMLIEKAGPVLDVAPASVVPVGSTCRICPRKACVARREPSIIAETL
jgi:predicted transcriptional regulator